MTPKQTMNYGLAKNLTLLFLLIFTLLNVFYRWVGINATITLQFATGLIYLVLAVADHMQRNSASTLPEDRFAYITNGMIAVKGLKLFAFTGVAIGLYVMGTRLQALSGIIIILVLGEACVFFFRLARKNYFISLFNNYILFALESDAKVFARHITAVEYRYDMLFLTKENKKVQVIELDKLSKNKKQEFIERFVLWAENNHVKFTDEARNSLKFLVLSS